MFIVKFLSKHIFLIALLVITAMSAALLEGMGLAMVFPVLQGMSGDGTASLTPFPLNLVSSFFVEIPVTKRLLIVSVVFFLITLAKNALLFANVLLAGYLRIAATEFARLTCIRQITQVDMAYYNKQKISDLILIIDAYADAVVGAIIRLIGTAIPLLCTIIFLLAMVILISWQLTLVSIILIGCASLITTVLAKKTIKISLKVVDSRYDFFKVLFDIIHGMKLIRLFNREKYMIDQFQEKGAKFYKLTYDTEKLTGAASPIFEIMGVGTLSLILMLGALVFLPSQSRGLGVLLTFVVILMRIIPPAKVLNNMRVVIAEKIPRLWEINKFLNSAGKKFVNNGTREFKSLEKEIEFRDVGFCYDPEAKTDIVLNHISLNIPKGASVGVVGASGSGKSTLIELLLRFYDPQNGKILIDGIDLREFDINTWRRKVGIVSQDTFLFNDTVRTNIAFAKLNASQEEIERAAKRAHAYDFIKALPQGFETNIGDKGVLLSGGQRQRLAIARAIVAEPDFLIFDEATSALDTQSEQIVQKALNEVAKGKTVITIAHRLSTLKKSDLIVVIDAGCIVEIGAPQELLKREGVYHQLIKRQSLQI